MSTTEQLLAGALCVLLPKEGPEGGHTALDTALVLPKAVHEDAPADARLLHVSSMHGPFVLGDLSLLRSRRIL